MPLFTLQDGRNELYQWDLNRKVIVEDPTVTEVHFCNRTDDCSLVVEVKDGLADIPNILLQDTWNIRVYAYCDCYTKVEHLFKVHPRTKPSDYVYTETEYKSYEHLEKKLNDIEEKGISDEAVTNAINDHLENNPINIYFKEEDGNVTAYIDTIPDAEEVSY